MKNLIIAVVVLLSFTTTLFAQQGKVKTINHHLLDIFPDAMPEVVNKNSKTVEVTKKHQKQQYQFFNKDTSFTGILRKGDTVLMYKNQPWLSLITRYMIEPVKTTTVVSTVKTVKVKQSRTRNSRQRRPMSPETQQVILQVGTQAAQQIFWRMSQQRW